MVRGMGDGQIMAYFDGVSKRYSRKSRGGSLRDTIPLLAARLLGNRGAGADAESIAREFWALRDVSFEVRYGEALGIIGHNGAGKSTILKLLAGVTAPTHGRARVNGRFAALIELGAGFHPDLTGRENVYLNGSILGLKKVEIDRKLESIVEFAGLQSFIDMPVKRYSSGMHARLGFSVAAHIEPEVLLVDEVLSVGDYAFQQKCMTKMEEFRRRGVAIVFVSHNMSAVLNLCSKALLIQRGRVMVAGTPREVIDTYTNATYSILSAEEHEHVALEIVGAQMCDGDARATRSFLSGERGMIKVHLRARRTVEDPVIGIGVRNSEATTVYGTNSLMLRTSVGRVDAGEEIVVAFPLVLHLCQGTYSVNASALPSEPGAVMDWRENLVAFDVFSDQTGIGSADLRATIRVERTRDLATRESA
jgi:lipopolysaccharide transport system ATP-binding protein